MFSKKTGTGSAAQEPSQLPGARVSARARNLETASPFEPVMLPVCISDDIFPLDTQSAAPRVREGLRVFYRLERRRVGGCMFVLYQMVASKWNTPSLFE